MAISNIPIELIDSFNRGKVVLFLGQDFGAAESGLPSMSSLTSELAKRVEAWRDCPLCREEGGCLRPNDCLLPLRQVATIYERENRLAQLVRFLQERLSLSTQIPPILQAITQLHVPVVITTVYDDRLERAYRAAGIRYQQITTDSQIVVDESAEVQIIHLYGAFSDFDSLVLTEAEHAALAMSKHLMSVFVQSRLATHACLFVGMDFNDPYFQTLYSSTVRELKSLRRLPYIVDAYSIRRSAVEAHMLQLTPSRFLTALRGEIDYRPAVLEPPPEPEAPYKFLNYYEAKDRAVFFGREAEIAELTSRIMSHRATILYAYSGMGKTSLIRAGVIPRLESEGFEIGSIRLTGENPVGALESIVSCSFNEGDNAKQMQSLGQILIVDQAEELFTVLTQEERRDFSASILSYLTDDQMDLHLFFSLRIEYLGQLEDLFGEQGYSGILKNRFRLSGLGREQARQAITKPAALFNVKLDDALVSALLAYLETADFDPSQLQILCSLLFQDLLEADQAKSKTITLKRYEELGKAEGILAGFLHNALRKIENDEIQEKAKTILKSMVTFDRTKVVLGVEEITRRVTYASLSERDVNRILQLLQAQRVVRGLEDGEYEVVHDTLVSQIWAWMDERDIARLNAAQILKQAISRYDKNHYLANADQQMTIEQAAGTMKLNAEELAVLLMSAIETNERQRARNWVDRIEEEIVESKVLAVLREAQQFHQVRDSALRAEILVRHREFLGALRSIVCRYFDEIDQKDALLYLDIDFEQSSGASTYENFQQSISSFCAEGKLDILLAVIMNELDIRGIDITVKQEDFDHGRLRRMLENAFDLDELRIVAFYLGVDFESLPAVGKSAKVRELISHLARRNRILDLLEISKMINPMRPWNEVLASARKTSRVGRSIEYSQDEDFDVQELANLEIDPPPPSESRILLDVLVARFDTREINQLKEYLGYFSSDFGWPSQTGKRDFARRLISVMKNKKRLDHLKVAIAYFRPLVTEVIELDLVEILMTRFDVEQIRTLCFDLGMRYGDIPGDTLIDKTQSLVQKMERADRVYELADAIIFPDRVGNDRYEVILSRRIEQMGYDGLQDLCFDLGISYGELPAVSLGAKSRELVDFVSRRKLLGELIFHLMYRSRTVLTDDEFWAVLPASIKYRNRELAYWHEKTEGWHGKSSLNKGEACRELVKHLEPAAFLRHVLVQYCTDQEYIRLWCYDLEVDYDSLPATTDDSKKRELIDYLYRRDRLQELEFLILRDYPDLADLIQGSKAGEKD